MIYAFFRGTAKCFDRNKVKGTKAKDILSQSASKRKLNDYITDELAIIITAILTMKLNNLKPTNPSLSLSAAKNN